MVASTAILAFPQNTPPAQTLVVLPFDNTSNAPGLQWVSEAFPEVLGQRLSSPSIYVISREDRLYAFDRLGIPTAIHPSRATLYRIAEQMDADYLVLGNYTFDGRTFTATAQVLDMKRLRLSPELHSSGPLTDLINIQRSLAYEAFKVVTPGTPVSLADFVHNAPPIRLDAFENYMRGILEPTRPNKIRYFREALRLNPQYTPATLQLGRTYFANREYESASSWLAKVPRSDQSASEANFLLGLSEFYLGQFDKAEAAFKVTESRLPLTEVYNNLGVVASRRGKRTAVEYFQRAVQADPNDADYHFNLGVALYRAGDSAGAARQLKDVVSRKPNDTEAKQLLEVIASGAAATGRPQESAANAAPPAPAVRVPFERIKRNYDETSYRQLALEIENAMEQSLAKTDPRTHAAYHVDRGRELLLQGFIREADKQFREAILRDPVNAGAHAGLARIAESNNDVNAARTEAQTSLRLHPTAEAYLVLARLALKDNNFEAAGDNVDRALALEPKNAVAAALKQSTAAKRTGVADTPQR